MARHGERFEVSGRDSERRERAPFGTSWVEDVRYCARATGLSTAIDVGAHRGETARRLAAAFPSLQVHAFEPVPESFAALAAATRGLSVRCVNAAVGDVDGRAPFRLGSDSTRSGFHAGGAAIEVPVVALDTYAVEQALERVDLLKIDAEGHEPWVLRGARGLLEAGRVRFVLAECEFTERADEPHGDFSEIFAILAPLGYRIVSFYTGGVDDLGWRWGDVLFLHVADARRGWVVSSPHDDVPPWPPPCEAGPPARG